MSLSSSVQLMIRCCVTEMFSQLAKPSDPPPLDDFEWQPCALQAAVLGSSLELYAWRKCSFHTFRNIPTCHLSRHLSLTEVEPYMPQPHYHTHPGKLARAISTIPVLCSLHTLRSTGFRAVLSGATGTLVCKTCMSSRLSAVSSAAQLLSCLSQ
jgi:hypothetical protein